ncbi:MAG TPA: hypothetical protein VFO82_08975 [Steroidobacteraceae bacterium]|nr:hypothetical protein [Steroidobacteraceae bacterium]
MKARSAFLALVLWLTASPSWAVLTEARVTPARNLVSVAQGGQTFVISWVIETTPVHPDGAVSAAGTFVNAATGQTIAPLVPTTVGVPTGTGPLTFPETVTITAAQLDTWRGQGIRLVGYRRSFVAPGSPTVSAQWLLQIRGSGLEGSREAVDGEIAVQRMDLVFGEGERIAIVERGKPLDAQVSIAYSGSGTLHGRWELADPGSSADGFFRVLQLVRVPLAGGRATTVPAPTLPTHTTGRHVLRFCVEEQSAEPCANSSTVVQTFYEVVPGGPHAALRGTTPNNQTIGAGGVFRWPAVDGAVTYQLQVFRPAVRPPGDAPDDFNRDPTFVTGALLPGGVAETTLSPLLRARLEAGESYLWRVTAHDADGQLIARSELARFVFRP